MFTLVLAELLGNAEHVPTAFSATAAMSSPLSASAQVVVLAVQ
jgi:hypothetical protein